MAEKHFDEQKEITQSYLIPYFQKHLPDFRRMKILEIGCAEAGFIDVLFNMGVDVTGIELEEHRVKTARTKNPDLNIILGDITDPKIVEAIGIKSDLVVMRDVIEHIPDRSAAFANIRKLMKTDGYLYITFPPRFSAFAGHQQNYRSILKFVPYLHLLPNVIIRLLGKIFKDKNSVTKNVISNYRVGLTLGRFEKYYTRFSFRPAVKELFLIRPVYQIRFGMKPIKFPNIPLIRETLVTGCECLLQKQ